MANDAYTDDGIYRLSMVESVLYRPAMYTVGGTFEEAVAFLEGWYSGLLRGRKDDPEAHLWFAVLGQEPPIASVSGTADPEALLWFAFRQWLAEDLGVSKWDVFKHISESLPDSKMSFLASKWSEHAQLTNQEVSNQ